MHEVVNRTSYQVPLFRACCVLRAETGRAPRALMASTKALHAQIFGSDDDSDDDDGPSKLSFAPAAPSAGGDVDDDEGVEAGDVSASSNLLMGGGKKGKGKEKKERKKPSSGEGRLKRKSVEVDEPRKKRTREPAADAGGEEDAAEPMVERAGDDPDEDSGSGSEAVEEGAKNDFERVMQRMKAKRGGVSFDRSKLRADVQELIARMDHAAEQDKLAIEEERPAYSRVLMLNEVVEMMRKKQYHEVLIDNGMLKNISIWLQPVPGPSGKASLPDLQLRTKLLNSLLLLDVDSTVVESLKNSRIGVFVKLFSVHPKESKENKRVALQLIEKWSRPIYNSSDKVQAKDLPMAAIPRRPRPAAAEEEANVFAMPSGPQTTNHARVPRPMGMDFAMLPDSEAKALASTKYGKESVKGKLTDRILHGKRKTVAQAVTLSVEGRTLDRI